MKTDDILACMVRNKGRYKAAVERTTSASIIYAGGYEAVRTTRWRLWEWYRKRDEYLQEQYAKAINEADNIIGKQWLYDRRPKLDRL